MILGRHILLTGASLALTLLLATCNDDRVATETEAPLAAAQPALSLLPASGAPGQQIEVRGQGFPPQMLIALRVGLPDLDAGLGEVDLVTAESDEQGIFNATLAIPTEWPGSETPVTEPELVVVAVDGATGQIVTSALFANKGIEVQPSLILSPGNGEPGQMVEVIGRGFAAGSLLGLRLGVPDAGLSDLNLVEVKVNEQGEFNTTLTIPTTWPGPGEPIIEADLVIAAVDTAANQTIATAPFFNTVAAAQPTLSLSPAQGVPGEEIQVTGQGFPANTQVALRMSLPEAGLTPFDLVEVESDEAGQFGVLLTIPTEWPGSGAPVTRADLIVAAVDEETGQTLTTAMFLNTAGSASASPSPGATLPASATTPGPTLPGRIVFTSDRDGNLELYHMAVDGSTPMRLTDNPAWDGAPALSPSGQEIAFVSEIRDSNGIPQDQEIYVMNSSGSGLTNVTNDPALDSQPAWSPDGSQIAFVSTRGADGPAKAIYVMQADGSDVRHLVADADLPAWSPDGTQIAFVSTGEGQIYVMDGDGGNVTRLTDDHSNGQTPANTRPIWSSDGTKLVFSTNRDGNAEIYIMRPDGSEQLNLTNDPASDSFPVWSPDGRYIAFISDRDGDSDIYVMSPGSAAIKALDSATNELLPAWSPDGNYLLFVSDASGSNEDIYLVHSAEIILQQQPGSPLNLTNNPAQDTFPLWLP